MDTLVAQYSRPNFESKATEDLDELLQDERATLNLKFAMPPIAQVSVTLSKASKKLQLTFYSLHPGFVR